MKYSINVIKTSTGSRVNDYPQHTNSLSEAKNLFKAACDDWGVPYNYEEIFNFRENQEVDISKYSHGGVNVVTFKSHLVREKHRETLQKFEAFVNWLCEERQFKYERPVIDARKFIEDQLKSLHS